MGKQPGFTMPEGSYAGDVSAKDAWTALGANDRALLVDVRTKVEWSLIGTPDLTALGREPVYIQWMTAQGPNPAFLDELQAAVAARGATQDTPLYFLCQSGGRSKVSAMQCTGLGFTACFNIADGFEGALDEHKHRNSVNGWKHAGLPWVQP